MLLELPPHSVANSTPATHQEESIFPPLLSAIALLKKSIALKLISPEEYPPELGQKIISLPGPTPHLYSFHGTEAVVPFTVVFTLKVVTNVEPPPVQVPPKCS